MLAGLLYLSALISFSLVVLWIVLFDAPGNQGGSQGLFAIKGSQELEKVSVPKKKSRWRRDVPTESRALIAKSDQPARPDRINSNNREKPRSRWARTGGRPRSW
jgi:hypothetical protein